jgi:hypothetical protein
MAATSSRKKSSVLSEQQLPEIIPVGSDDSILQLVLLDFWTLSII